MKRDDENLRPAARSGIERIRHELEHGSRKTRDIGMFGVAFFVIVIVAFTIIAAIIG